MGILTRVIKAAWNEVSKPDSFVKGDEFERFITDAIYFRMMTMIYCTGRTIITQIRTIILKVQRSPILNSDCGSSVKSSLLKLNTVRDSTKEQWSGVNPIN